MELRWTFSNIWNESLEQGKERELAPRQHIWATELGGAMIDRFLKMKAAAYTNPPNVRSLRKFEAGNMMQWIVELVLRRAGILREAEEWVKYQYDGLLPVTGRLDFIAGGKPDWEKAQAEIQWLNLPEFFNRATLAIMRHFQERYPDGLAPIVLEIKSCSTFMYERYEQYGLQTAKSHALQLFHYLKAKNEREGHLVYICKDDLRMLELGVLNPSWVEELYRKDIENLTAFIKNDKRPPLEKEIVWNEDTNKFSTNWRVEYSQYLEMLYRYKEPIDYREKWDKTVAQWNRTLGRCIKGDKMTDLNKQTIEEIKQFGFDFEVALEKAKQSKQGGLDEEKTNHTAKGQIQIGRKKKEVKMTTLELNKREQAKRKRDLQIALWGMVWAGSVLASFLVGVWIGTH